MIGLIADHTGHVTVGSVMTSATINSGYRGPKVLGVPVEPSNPAKEPDNTTLPEDCHYQLEDLVKLLYLPNVMCLGKRGMRHSEVLAKSEISENYWCILFKFKSEFLLL
ncbi:hypothetical protein Tco_0834960 [Tanacetum coccineum]